MELQIKRGRPRKLTESQLELIKTKYQQLSQQKKDSMKEIREYYNESVFSQNMLLMISKIQKFLGANVFLKTLPLELLLIDSCKNQIVSEIELAAISLILENVNYGIYTVAGDNLIECVAWVAKELLESDQMILSGISLRLMNEIKNFQQIEKKIKSSVKIDIKKLNIRYQALKSDKEIKINYTNYVIDILRHSPPYKKKKEENSDEAVIPNPNNPQSPSDPILIKEPENIYERSIQVSRKNEDSEEFYKNLHNLHIIYSEIEPFQQIDRIACASPEKVLNTYDNSLYDSELLSVNLNPLDLKFNTFSSNTSGYMNSNKI